MKVYRQLRNDHDKCRKHDKGYTPGSTAPARMINSQQQPVGENDARVLAECVGTNGSSRTFSSSLRAAALDAAFESDSSGTIASIKAIASKPTPLPPNVANPR